MLPELIPTRLGKYLRERTGQSLSALEAAARNLRIVVNGEVTVDLRQFVFSEDQVTLDNDEICHAAPLSYAIINKPRGIVTSVRSPNILQDLTAWLNEWPVPVFPVGRLDRDSGGLLLLTNDGDLAFALLSPSHHVEKEYVVGVSGTLHAEDPRLARLLTPMDIDGEVHRIKTLSYLGTHPNRTELGIVLTEGKHRQIRKMARQVGLRVVALSRVRIGPLTRPSLPEGALDELSPTEVESLWASVGGHRCITKRKVAALSRVVEAARTIGRPHFRLERFLEVYRD